MTTDCPVHAPSLLCAVNILVWLHVAGSKVPSGCAVGSFLPCGGAMCCIILGKSLIDAWIGKCRPAGTILRPKWGFEIQMLMRVLRPMERWCVAWDSLAPSFGKWGDIYLCRMLYELEAVAVNISHIVAASDIIFNNLFSPLQHLPQRILITCWIICFCHSLSQGCDLGLARHFLSLLPNEVHDVGAQ